MGRRGFVLADGSNSHFQVGRQEIENPRRILGASYLIHASLHQASPHWEVGEAFMMLFCQSPQMARNVIPTTSSRRQ